MALVLLPAKAKHNQSSYLHSGVELSTLPGSLVPQVSSPGLCPFPRVSPRLRMCFYAHKVFIDREKENAILAEIEDLTAQDDVLALSLDQQGEKGTCTLKTRVLDT